MAIGTSGYVEAVHLQQAPLKPDSGLKAAKMLSAIGNLAGASMDLYSQLNKPTNEQLIDLRQQFDSGLQAVISSNPTDPEYLSKAIRNYEDNFNSYLTGLGTDYVESLQAHIYNETKPHYAAPQTLQQQLAIQESNLGIEKQITDTLSSIDKQNLAPADRALEVAKGMAGIREQLNPAQRLKFGPALQEAVTKATSASVQATNKTNDSIELSKQSAKYLADIRNHTNSLLDDKFSYTEKSTKHKTFKQDLLARVEKEVPLKYRAAVYGSISTELDRLDTQYSAAASKEQQKAERTQIITGRVTEFQNGRISLDQAFEPFKGRADKVEAQADFLEAYQNGVKERLSAAAQSRNAGVYNAQKAIVKDQLTQIKNHLYLGQNNNIDSRNQYTNFDSNIDNIEKTILSTLDTSLRQEAETLIYQGKYKEASEVSKQLADFGRGTTANIVSGKIISDTNLTREMMEHSSAGVFDADIATNRYAKASKEGKENITRVMSFTTKAYMDSMAAAENLAVKKDIIDSFNNFISNKQKELKGVRDQFSLNIDAAQSTQEIVPYLNLIQDVGSHNASLVLGKEQVKELNKTNVLLKYLPDLRPGQELSDVRDRLIKSEGNPLQGKVLEAFQDSTSKASEIPVVDDRTGFIESARVMYKTLDIVTANKAVKELFEKAKEMNLKVGDSYVVGVPNTVFQKPSYYENALSVAVGGINQSFPEGQEGTATVESLSETHNMQQLPSGDVAFVPKTGAGTATQSLVVSKEEIIKNLEKNYDGSPEMYDALREATKSDTNEGEANRANVIHKLWEQNNPDTIRMSATRFSDHYDDSAAAEIQNQASDMTSKIIRGVGEWYEQEKKDYQKAWDLTIEAADYWFTQEVIQTIDGLDNLLFGEDAEEAKPIENEDMGVMP